MDSATARRRAPPRPCLRPPPLPRPLEGHHHDLRPGEEAERREDRTHPVRNDYGCVPVSGRDHAGAIPPAEVTPRDWCPQAEEGHLAAVSMPGEHQVGVLGQKIFGEPGLM